MNPEAFRTTHWSVIVAAGGRDSQEAAVALEHLCETYWYPVYAFVRRLGHNEADAKDLVQGFFEDLILNNRFAEIRREHGRFRNYLRTAVKNHRTSQWRKSAAKKRRDEGGLLPISLTEAEERYLQEPASNLDPEILYERRWAETLLESVLKRLEFEFDGIGKNNRFTALKRFLLKEQDLSYREVSRKLNLSESAVKSAIHRMRLRFRELLRQEVLSSVADPSECDDEIRHLFKVFSS